HQRRREPLGCVSAEAGLLYTFGDALHGKLGPSSRLGGHSNQPPALQSPPPSSRSDAAAPSAANVMTLRAPGDPALTATDSDEADDPLDSMSARSRAAATHRTGCAAAAAPQLPSRQKYRELARSSGTTSMPPSMLNGNMTFELVRPAMPAGAVGFGWGGGRFCAKEDAALAASEPEVKPLLLRRPSESKPSADQRPFRKTRTKTTARRRSRSRTRGDPARQPTADEQPVSAPVLIEEMASEQRQTPGCAAEAAAPTDEAGGTQQRVKSGRCGRRKRPVASRRGCGGRCRGF
uniref:PPM-type phosphatase domain-containing protein n=1 Tax=Macrostomum lignano TaxID=282301 RepID=A0A1I8FMB8_9PLAT